MSINARTIEDLKRIRKSNALKPTRDTLREQFPQHYSEGVNKQTGKKEWRFSIPLRDGSGARTRAGKVLQEMMSPYAASEAKRARARPAAPTEPLMTPRGDTVYAPAARAREFVDALGYSTPGRISGLLATQVHGDFCARCDLRRSWCECWQTRRDHADFR